MEPIGVIHSPFQQKFAIPAKVLSEAKFQRKSSFLLTNVVLVALTALTLLATFGFFFISTRQLPAKKAKWQLPVSMVTKSESLLARSPHRPNSIGLTLCRLTNVHHSDLTIEIQGCDLIDRTPILDIKPYLAYADRPEQWQEGWHDQYKLEPMHVEFSPKAAAALKSEQIPDSLTSIIEQTLKWDPRPAHQRENPGPFATYIAGFNIEFCIHHSVVSVLHVQSAKSDQFRASAAVKSLLL